LQRQGGEAALQHRHHAALHHVPHRLVEIAPVARRRFEQVQRADVHRRRLGFEVEEGAIDPAQGFDPGLLAATAAHLSPCRGHGFHTNGYNYFYQSV
jgi:hypothetical protein